MNCNVNDNSTCFISLLPKVVLNLSHRLLTSFGTDLLRIPRLISLYLETDFVTCKAFKQTTALRYLTLTLLHHFIVIFNRIFLFSNHAVKNIFKLVIYIQ